MNAKERAEKRRMEGYRHFLYRAYLLAWDPDNKRKLKSMLIAAHEQKWVLGSPDGPVVQVYLTDGRISGLRAQELLSAWVLNAFSIGREFSKALMVARAHGEDLVLLVRS